MRALPPGLRKLVLGDCQLGDAEAQVRLARHSHSRECHCGAYRVSWVRWISLGHMLAAASIRLRALRVHIFRGEIVIVAVRHVPAWVLPPNRAPSFQEICN